LLGAAYESHAAGAGNPDPIATLRLRHDAVRAFLASHGAADVAAADLLAYLENVVRPHMRAEETLFFSPLRAAALPWNQQAVDQAVAEHDQIGIVAADLRAALGPPGDANATAEHRSLRQIVEDLVHTLRAHFDTEEQSVYPLAAGLLSTETRANISRGLAAATTKEKATMPEQRGDESTLRGRTTGSPERPAQQLTGPMLRFDLAAEIAALHQESSWQQGDRNSKTLVKEGDFRAVLTTMRSGARLARHETAARFTLQVLEGSLTVAIEGETLTLAPGHILALNHDVSHDVTALTDCAFLLTLVWPTSQESGA
jgi:quercetin dioxygenase-like cupin family protein/hemerythrin-like domain-containing protein